MFTTQKHAETFCGEYSKERNRVFPFMVLETAGTFLGQLHRTSWDVVVLNDKSADERVLTADELATVARLTARH